MKLIPRLLAFIVAAVIGGLIGKCTAECFEWFKKGWMK